MPDTLRPIDWNGHVPETAASCECPGCDEMSCGLPDCDECEADQRKDAAEAGGES